MVCHENKSGTIFECPSSHLLSDTDEIEFEVYSEVDLTRQSLSACATGTTMKGTRYLILLFLLVHLQFTAPFSFHSGIPANPVRDFQWIKIKQTKLNFCKRIFQMMPQFFHHHQIDLAQRDGLKINLTQITSESFLLLLIADYAENYTHLAQVHKQLQTFIYFPIFPTQHLYPLPFFFPS